MSGIYWTSTHSEPMAYEAGSGAIDVLLTNMIAVEFDDENMQVTALAGCHLGVDPEDPSGTSTRENSLFRQLEEHGWALPDTGGITHQTVAGFLSTGSARGGLQHSPADLIVKIRLIDGTGSVDELTRSDDPNDPFYAAGVLMGLLGVITAVTLQCVERYTVQGQEDTTTYDDCQIDLFEETPASKPGLETFLRRTEHSRLLWWPQKGVKKVTVWQASKAELPIGFNPKPYRQVPRLMGFTWPAYAALNLVFRLLDGLNPLSLAAFWRVTSKEDSVCFTS